MQAAASAHAASYMAGASSATTDGTTPGPGGSTGSGAETSHTACKPDNNEAVPALAAVGLDVDFDNLSTEQLMGRRRAWAGKGPRLQNSKEAVSLSHQLLPSPPFSWAEASEPPHTPAPTTGIGSPAADEFSVKEMDLVQD